MKNVKVFFPKIFLFGNRVDVFLTFHFICAKYIKRFHYIEIYIPFALMRHYTSRSTCMPSVYIIYLYYLKIHITFMLNRLYIFSMCNQIVRPQSGKGLANFIAIHHISYNIPTKGYSFFI